MHMKFRMKGHAAGALATVVLGAFGGPHTSPFYHPKLMAFLATAAAAAGWLALRSRIRVPSRGTLVLCGFFGLLAAILAINAPNPLPALVAVSVPAAGFFVYLALINLDQSDRETVLWWILTAAVIQAVIAGLQYTRVLPCFDSFWDVRKAGAIGTVGNPEFLATLLGCSVFAAVRFIERSRNPRIIIGLTFGITVLLAGLVLTHNKGTLLFLFLYLVWRVPAPHAGRIAVIAAIPVILAIMLPHSFLDRVILWIAAGKVFLDHPLVGIGPGQYGNYYLDALDSLFSSHPALASVFGTYSGDIRDPHNLILGQGAELGIAGLVLAAIFSLYGLKTSIKAGGPLGAALLMLVVKCQYTVVVPSVTGAILLAVFVALSSKALPPSIRSPVWPKLLPLLSLALLLPAFRLATADRAAHQGNRLLLLGDLAGAESRFQTALAANPREAEAHLSIAFMAFRRRQYPAMDRGIVDALDCQRHVDIVKRAAHLYFFSHQYSLAEPIYEKLARIYPDRRSAFVKLAEIRRALGDPTGARILARRVIEMKPRIYNPFDAGYLSTARRILELTSESVRKPNRP